MLFLNFTTVFGKPVSRHKYPLSSNHKHLKRNEKNQNKNHNPQNISPSLNCDIMTSNSTIIIDTKTYKAYFKQNRNNLSF